MIVDAGVATASASIADSLVDGNVLNVGTGDAVSEALNAAIEFIPFDPNGSGTYPVAVVGTSNDPATIGVSSRGSLYVENRVLPIIGDPIGVVDDIEDLPANPDNGDTYQVLGTTPGREMVIAVYYEPDDEWTYQPVAFSQTTIAITFANPTYGVRPVMSDYISYNGSAHVPRYWSKSTLDGTLSYQLQNIPSDSSYGAFTPTSMWRWKVGDLRDPGTGSYELTSWPETSGSGPTWVSNYPPTVRNRTKFHITKNKKTDQRSINFIHTKVNHLTMEADVSTPFTVIIVGIIQSYPTAKYGHYLLDSGKQTAVRSLAGGKDYYFSEGTNPRQAMLFMKRTARVATNNQPAKDMKKFPNIQFAHSEKPRPRMFYAVFNGSDSFAGAIDSKNRFYGAAPLTDFGTHHFWCIGRRVNRVSDNRSTHLSLWDVAIVHDALTQQEIDLYYENIANEYRFGEYS